MTVQRRMNKDGRHLAEGSVQMNELEVSGTQEVKYEDFT